MIFLFVGECVNWDLIPDKDNLLIISDTWARISSSCFIP